MTADVFYMPTPRHDTPTVPGYYVEAHIAHDMPYIPVYRYYASGDWLLGGQKLPAHALPDGLVRLVPEEKN